jgi:hypothetical protein
MYSWNDVAFGVAIMGRYDVNNEHCKAALDAAQLLFRHLQENQKLADDFIVYGLRQVRPFESPVIELYIAIQQWPQWVRMHAVVIIPELIWLSVIMVANYNYWSKIRLHGPWFSMQLVNIAVMLFFRLPANEYWKPYAAHPFT